MQYMNRVIDNPSKNRSDSKTKPELEEQFNAFDCSYVSSGMSQEIYLTRITMRTAW